MTRLSEPLKALINAAAARPGVMAAPKNMKSIIQSIVQEAKQKNVGRPAWVTIATATSMTMNSPDSLLAIHAAVTQSESLEDTVEMAELIREVGLKCISFNGIPRVINCLGAFRQGLPADVAQMLSTESSRSLDPLSIQQSNDRGQTLWKSIYAPHSTKLVNKLAESHPNLPVHILSCHYGPLLADPTGVAQSHFQNVGRVLTSLAAVACLRAQTGVGPQVVSHVFGLRKAYEDGTANAEGEELVEGGEWLASDEGSIWVLQVVDRLVEAIGLGQGTTFSPGMRAKL